MKWNKDTKEIFGYIFAACSLIFGFGLTIAGFIVDPLGVVSESVLWVLGQCFVFAGGVTGIALSVDNMKKTVKAEIIKELKEDE